MFNVISVTRVWVGGCQSFRKVTQRLNGPHGSTTTTVILVALSHVMIQSVLQIIIINSKERCRNMGYNKATKKRIEVNEMMMQWWMCRVTRYNEMMMQWWMCRVTRYNEMMMQWWMCRVTRYNEMMMQWWMCRVTRYNEMMMQWWMCRVTRYKKIRNKHIRGTRQVPKRSWIQLDWYGHVMRRDEEHIMGKVLRTDRPGKG